MVPPPQFQSAPMLLAEIHTILYFFSPSICYHYYSAVTLKIFLQHLPLPLPTNKVWLGIYQTGKELASQDFGKRCLTTLKPTVWTNRSSPWGYHTKVLLFSHSFLAGRKFSLTLLTDPIRLPRKHDNYLIKQFVNLLLRSSHCLKSS